MHRREGLSSITTTSQPGPHLSFPLQGRAGTGAGMVPGERVPGAARCGVLGLPSLTPSAPSLAGYQGSFHSIQSCFPYSDCYQNSEPAASGDRLAREVPGFTPLRPNSYPSLSAPLPAAGEGFCVHCPKSLGQPRGMVVKLR